MYVAAALHQLDTAVRSVSGIFTCIADHMLEERPFVHKRSIGELASHLSILMLADLRIADESGKEEMDQFYKDNTPQTLAEMEKALFAGFERLTSIYTSYSAQELAEKTTSYWGVFYTRFEWLLEIVGHFYHHRAQLHMMLTALDVQTEVRLFE